VVRIGGREHVGEPIGEVGLKMMASQVERIRRAVCASRGRWGVCIQLLADRIQKAEIAVPAATKAADITCSQGGTRRQPNSITPRKVDSRKKAVSTS